ncbi:hypothetical protein OB69_03620 [Roseivirga seohaensis subsp. aquiponti]|uniref:Uncharacterized protein n=1 Tax=Roseivirga seohaensis subsp. aquiponti TaxID=1566026 RepID=A0A0L8APJ0_9BACT|nr:hypothetical protein [Roseivirga seohaensis]KOF04087.1 hypothetical protein OB69_03620 [Roseivirga seohaensis subsp. aquiponti]
MKKLLFLILVLICNSCNQSRNKASTESKEPISPSDTLQINQSILTELGHYQEEYPIPHISVTNYYHYHIIIDGNLIKFMRIGFLSPEDLQLELKGMFYYNSKPVSLMDLKSKKTSELYNKGLFNDSLMSSFQMFDFDDGFDETFPPVWKYNVKSGDLVLIEKDTVWQHWK